MVAVFGAAVNHDGRSRSAPDSLGVPGGVQSNANISRCRKGVDISLLLVGPSDSDHHLKRAVERQVGSSVEITQEVSALASVGL